MPSISLERLTGVMGEVSDTQGRFFSPRKGQPPHFSENTLPLREGTLTAKEDLG